MQAEMYRLHNELQSTHWWFTARREIVLAALRRALARRGATGAPLRLVDVGCGAGGMLPWLGEFGTAYGIDPSPEAVECARALGVEVRLGGLPDSLGIPPTDPVDVLLLLDVLEHVPDDALSLQSLHATLRPGGLLLITVPAFQFLWSGHDVVNQHCRRYSRRQLRERLEHAGFRVDGISYYNTALFAPIAAVRLLGRMLPGRADTPDLARVSPPLNTLLHRVFAAERRLVPEIPLPFGVSLIAAATALPRREDAR